MPITISVDPAEAPARWNVPWPSPPNPGCALEDGVTAALAQPAQGAIHLRGGEPLDHPGLHEALTRLTEAGRATAIWTTLPGLNDDDHVRPFAPHDVRFRVELPATDPALLSTLTGGAADLDQLEFALRNLQAFSYPFDLVIPVAKENVHALADTAAHLLRRWTLAPVHLQLVMGTHDADPRWDHTPRWEDVNHQLLQLQTRDLRRPPRVHLTGIPALALSLEDFDRLDLRVPDRPDDPLVVPEAYAARHGTPTFDGDALAQRRVWLVTEPKERPSFRSHPMDRFREATSVVLLREEHTVFAVLEARREGVPYLIGNATYGVAIAGRFKDATLAQRFGSLCQQVRANAKDEPPMALGRLRALAHVLRRSMKPRHDDKPIVPREEGE